MPTDDLNNSLTSFLSAQAAAKLTPAAQKLTKQGMLNAMNAYANGGNLTGGLQKADILSVRDAFAERRTAVGVLADSDLGDACCCCCATASTTSVGPLKFSEVGMAPGAWSSAAVEADSSLGDSCCCCCI
jgi:hypothetical protein